MAKSWAFMRRFDIRDEATGELYLRRWYLLSTPWFGIYLHKILTPDKDRDLHDHPWAFLSMVLWGGYDEALGVNAMDSVMQGYRPFSVIRRRTVFSIAHRHAHDAHRITRLHRSPTWTFLVVGKRRRSWGFYTANGYVDWKRYLGLEDDTDG